MLTCAINSKELDHLRTTAREFLQASNSVVSVRQKDLGGIQLFGILMRDADGNEEWVDEAWEEGSLWVQMENAEAYLYDEFLPNLGYRVLRDKVKRFQQLLHA